MLKLLGSALKKYIIPESDGVDRKRFHELEVIPRRWGILPTLDCYVLREFLIKLSILMLVFVLGFIMGNVFDELGDFIEGGASLGTIIGYMLLRLPGNIRFILPISMLLGCIWTMAAFGKNQEITAMRASGISLFRCGGPIFMVGLLVTGINIYFNENLVPRTEREADIIVNSVKGRSDAEGKKMLAYRSNDGRRAWFFRIFDTDDANQHVIFKSYRPDGTLEYDLNAESAVYTEQQNWTFSTVRKTEYTKDGLMPFSTQRFDTFTLTHEEAPETNDDIMNAIKDEEDLPSWVILDLLKRSKNMSARMRNIYLTLFFYRLAYPWSCFLAVFLGIPLATKSERSGIMLAIISAVLVIVAYIICAQMFLMLGKRGTVNPVIAGLAPTVCFIMYGYYKVVFNRS